MPPKVPTKKEGRAAPSSAVEHVLNIIKAGLATAPFTGGIASLMTDYIPSRKQKRLEEFAQQVAADLERLQDRIDKDTILTDEFAFLFEQTFRGVAENYQAEKFEAFRGILINAAIGTNLASDEQEYFLSLVNNLSVLHIRILSFMAGPQRYLDARRIPGDHIRGGFSQFFPIVIPGVHVEVIKNAFGDLYQAGLITTDKTIFATMTSSHGLDLLGDRVSELGKRFISFCTVPI
jgi:hypothetical protein